MTVEPENTSAKSATDTRYLAAVGGLLVLIIACLAILWFSESRRRLAAEGDVDVLKRRSVGMEAMLTRKMLAVPAEPLAVVREQLPARTVDLDGKATTALMLGAEAGERMGFSPGDVIMVCPRPATQPSSVP